MASSYDQIFAGTLLVLLDFSIGNFDILMDPIGYIMIILALVKLYKKTNYSPIKYGICTGAILLLVSILPYVGISYNLNSSIPIGVYLLTILSMGGVALLTFIIYLTTYRVMEIHDESYMCLKVKKESSQYLIVSGFMLIAISMIMVMPLNWLDDVIITTVMVNVLLQIRYLAMLHQIKKTLKTLIEWSEPHGDK